MCVCVACIGIGVYVEARVPTTAANGCLALYTVQNDEYTFTCSSGLLSGCYFLNTVSIISMNTNSCVYLSVTGWYMNFTLHKSCTSE